MTGKHLHIVSLDVPYPVVHGGMIDLFHKLQALKRAGVSIHLHCFEYGKGQQQILEDYCEEVLYYPRKTGFRGFSGDLPYIVSSRTDPALRERLLQDEYPILLEGIHCTSVLLEPGFNNRKIFVRLHNIEYEYYEQLAASESSPLRRMYYHRESRLLRVHEKNIADRAIFLAVSEKDAATYQKNFHADVRHLPVFVAWDKVESVTGSGHFCLYHGNLSVAENEYAARWLQENIFEQMQVPFVVAGKDPSRKLRKLLHSSPQSCYAANPGDHEMDDLIRKAQINVLPAFNRTGVKLKLIHALFEGRHCVTNAEAVEGSGLESCCHISGGIKEMKKTINDLLHADFTQQMITERSSLLKAIYDNDRTAQKLIGMIW